MELSEQTRLAVAEDVSWQRVGSDTVILSLESGYIYTCNGTTACMLELADGQRTLAELAEAMLAEFDVERRELLGDLLAMAGKLLEEKLLRKMD